MRRSLGDNLKLKQAYKERLHAFLINQTLMNKSRFIIAILTTLLTSLTAVSAISHKFIEVDGIFYDISYDGSGHATVVSPKEANKDRKSVV